MGKRYSIGLLFLLLVSCSFAACSGGKRVAGGDAVWGGWVTVADPAVFETTQWDARKITPGKFGAEYGRMAKLANGDWVAVYTVYNNSGYTVDPNGGTSLEISVSKDNCRTWEVISILQEPGRDMDNGQITVLKNEDLLLSCRSVRWQESYKVDVYKSEDGGKQWKFLSTVDENHGQEGELGWPDKGVYEPHLDYISENELAVFYANETHVMEKPGYSQIISEKISTDNGATWGEEIFVAWDSERAYARPGMPVFAQMGDGRFIVVFEDGVDDDYNVHYKTSLDGKTWDEGLGTAIPGQVGGPYITTLSNNRLLVISNSCNVSYSDNNGETWITNQEPPWTGSFPDYCWASCYQTGKNEIAVMGSAPRNDYGHKVQLRLGEMTMTKRGLFSFFKN